MVLDKKKSLGSQNESFTVVTKSLDNKGHWQLYSNLLFHDCLVLKATVQTVAVHDLFGIKYNQKMTWFIEGVICELFWRIFRIFSTGSLKKDWFIKVICSQTGHHGSISQETWMVISYETTKGKKTLIVSFVTILVSLKPECYKSYIL